MRRASRNLATLVMGLILVLVTGCIPAPGEITPPPPPEEAPAPEVDWGIIEIQVTDPPPADVTSAVVYLTNIEVHQVSGNASGWIPIIGAPPSFDLMDVIGVAEILGSANVTAGSFTQIRMDVEKVEVEIATDDTTEKITAEVPSEKLRIVGPFNVGGGRKTVLTLDFDGEKSLILPGKDIATGKERALFKPVVKLLVETEEMGVTAQEKEREKEKGLEAEGQEFEGTIKAIDGDNWTVTIEDEDWTVDVSEAEIDGEPEEGLQAEIKGIVVDDTIVASEVDIEEEEPEKESEQEKEKEAEGLEFEGTIKAIDGDNWTVTIEDEDWTVDVSEAEIDGEPEEGLEAEIKGIVVDDTIVASEVDIEEAEEE